MTGVVKLFLAGGLVAALPFLPAALPGPSQDPKAADPFHQEAVWNFAVLQYSDRGEVVEIPAKNITKIWLLATDEGRLRMEILYENRDYSMVELGSFNIIRRSGSLSAVDVPIVRTRLAGMAFPAFR